MLHFHPSSILVACGLSALSLGCSGVVDAGLEDGNFDTERVLQVDIQMAPEDWDALRNQTRSFVSELSGDCMAAPHESPYTYFHASITMDGESLPDVGIRKKGFIGSQSTTKPGFRINLDEYVPGAELFGKDNLTLNNSVQDPSLIRQCLSYHLFRKAGLPASKCNFARVSMNGEDLGVYVHVEPVKRSFLRDHFGHDDGDLYEGTISDFREAWHRTFQSKTIHTDTELTQVTALMDALDSREPKRDVIERYFDLAHLLNFLAMENIIGHWDGYGGNRNNFFVFWDRVVQQFFFIPWGVDGTMNDRSLDAPLFAKARLPYHLLKDTELSRLFKDQIRMLLDVIWVEEEVLAEVDRMVALLETEIDLTPHAEGIDNLRNYISGRRGRLIDQLDRSPPALEESPYCLAEKGSIEAAFETRWDTIGEGTDLTREGDLEIDMIWEGDRTQFVRSGVGAGFSDDDGTPLVVIVGLLDERNGAMFIPYVSFDPAQVVPGRPMPVQGSGVGGAVLYRDNNIGGMVQAGFMNEPELTFDAFEAVAGSPVSGRLRTTLWSWEPQ